MGGWWRDRVGSNVVIPDPRTLGQRRRLMKSLRQQTRLERKLSLATEAFALPLLAYLIAFFLGLPLPDWLWLLSPVFLAGTAAMVLPAGHRKYAEAKAGLLGAAGGTAEWPAEPDLTWFPNPGHYVAVGLTAAVILGWLALLTVAPPVQTASIPNVPLVADARFLGFASVLASLPSFVAMTTTVRVGIGRDAMIFDQVHGRFRVPRSSRARVRFDATGVTVTSPLALQRRRRFRIDLEGNEALPLGIALPDGLRLRVARALDPEHFAGDPLEHGTLASRGDEGSPAR